MSGLNPAQQDAVDTLSGPLLVLAGAGTGKTRVITFRIAKLIQHGVPRHKILGVTFTNKAANEMKERLTALIGGKTVKHKYKKKAEQGENEPTISTFHSLCVRILRRRIDKLGYPLKFAIYNRGDQESLARQILREIKVGDKLLKPNQLLFHISNWKCKSLNPKQAMLQSESDAQHIAAVGFERYQKQLKLRGCVDFDDLLLLTEQLFREHPDVREEEAARFEHLLVDEYQDTNTSQYRIVKALAGEHRNLCVVGDDDQSIYAWRGAEVEHILAFAKDWPDAKVVRLEDNYRSTEAIIKYANTLIRFNSTRHDKVLRAARPGGEVPSINQWEDEVQEAEQVVRSIKNRLNLHGREPRDFAILFRTNEQPRPFETALREAKLPYILVGGMSFFDRKEVKDTLAYLRLLEDDPDEISILRIINTPPRGIGKKSIENLLNKAVREKVPMWDMVRGYSERPKCSARVNQALDHLASVVNEVRSVMGNASLVDQARKLISRIDYKSEIDRIYPEPEDRESRWNVVEQVVNALSDYEEGARKPTMTKFLDRLLLGDQSADNDKEKQLKKNAIALMTMHAAKGLEFPEVYMVGMEEGILPHQRSLDDDEAGVPEERRLCYVGVTRAEERLTMSMSLTRKKWGKARDTKPSRFLYELTDQADNPNYAKTRGK
jgi:DNA helicase-2/ATP-dependent DNA helicase PcrA